jgi:thiol:disulfide interchange protein
MSEFINNNSATILAVLILGIAGMFGWEQRRNWRGLAVIALVLFVLGAGWTTARHGGSDIANLAELDAAVASGTPVVLELYSDTCTLCLISNRSVNAMEADLEGRAVVVRVSADEQVGRDAARRYGMRSLPTFVVLSADGREVFRDTGSPDIDAIKEAALSPG